MFSRPLFIKERQASARKRQPFLFRTVFTIVLSLIALLISLVLYTSRSNENTALRMLYAGRALLIAMIVVELLFLLFFIPSLVAGSIAEEREKDTFSMLLLTRLTPFEIVLTKLFARWLPAANLVLIGFPFAVASAWLAGLEREAALAMVVLLFSSAFMASLSILASARREQAMAARGESTGWIFGWLLGPPIVSIIPVASGTLWGDLLFEGKRLCTFVAPSSPVSLLTDPSWYNGTISMGLEARVALMVGLQVLFGALAVWLASGRLKAREKNPNWIDPTLGFRPPCGDDPIYWREYEMPFRRGGVSPMVLLLRSAWILIRAVLINVLALLATLLVLAVPLGLLVATLYYGFEAFKELREFGYGGSGPFVSRGHFNMLIRAATGTLALLPAAGMAAAIAGRITAERDKKTWEAFLLAPLSGEEILRSKARVAVHAVWYSARPLLVLWLMGIALGVVNPLGVALAAIDLVLIAWASVALGLFLGVRPSETATVSNRSAMAMLACFALHAPFLFVAFASPRELAMVATLDIRLRWGLGLALLAIPVATALVARYWTKQTFKRFDEWVGRPWRDPQASPPPALPNAGLEGIGVSG